ncbi:MAG: segregation and condensation protein A [Anaerolineae bacterium]
MALEVTQAPDRQEPTYQVRLPVFEGPVDLLLRLIEERELAITAVSLAAVADQYLEHIRSLDQRNAAELAAFIEVAARLLLIKSRTLLPSAPQEAEEDEEDIAAALVRRLEEYRRFRRAAQWLAERRESGPVLFAREPTLPEEPTFVPKPISPNRLLAALTQVLSRVEEAPEDAGQLVSPVTYSLPQKLRLVLRRLWNDGVVAFAELIRGARCRSEVVVTFLAVLELVRRRRADATQDGLFGSITITRPG